MRTGGNKMFNEAENFANILCGVCESIKGYASCVQQERRTLNEMYTCVRLVRSVGEEGTKSDVKMINSDLKNGLEKIQGIIDNLEKFVKAVR